MNLPTCDDLVHPRHDSLGASSSLVGVERMARDVEVEAYKVLIRELEDLNGKLQAEVCYLRGCLNEHYRRVL